MSALKRVSVVVPHGRAEEARAALLGLFPQGFEEREEEHGVELAAYTDGAGEEQMRAVFAGARVVDVERNWQERWRAYHRPVQVGPLWIGPPWESPPADAVAVVVDPGRAFGTGAHATTRLCLEVLLEVPRGSLVDVGCGSGVLAIAASKLGFAPVIALDVDPQAVDATQRNAAANDVELETRLGDAVADALPAADAIVANVTGEVVARLRVEAEWLVTSGYLESDQPTPPGYVAVERRGREGWAADLHRRQ